MSLHTLIETAFPVLESKACHAVRNPGCDFIQLRNSPMRFATTAADDEPFAPPSFEGLRIEPRMLWGDPR